MRLSTAVLFLLTGVAAAFAPSSINQIGNGHSHVVVKENTALQQTPTDDDDDDHEKANFGAAPITQPSSSSSSFIPLPIMTTLAASLFMLAPLSPPVAHAAAAPVAAVEKAVSSEQLAIQNTKSALQDATLKYTQALKVQKEAASLDSKAEAAVESAQKKFEKARKSFITANDKLSAARTKGDQTAIATQTKIVGEFLIVLLCVMMGGLDFCVCRMRRDLCPLLECVGYEPVCLRIPSPLLVALGGTVCASVIFTLTTERLQGLRF